ncbi:family 10 glycosylhydrolase [Chamaesiphon sp. VAR_48_metabat_135_sub]|uniref:glycoside hydrolase family 10 protein n=1 Tax=Chamaesiphon sp. VAR_48_metabat_135_sub TaxID=2964699 RepID=UPI00286B4C9A|nr:family 10 glycosylhydrolase [Chamaesiphon sp. VAR_48_metabat_135_sub]
MLKAVWLTNIDSAVMNSRKDLAEGLQRLSELGFNTIYPVVWQRGYTLYPSQVAQQLTGSALLPNSPFVGRDVLAEILELAHPLKMRTIPWFEYGLMVPPKSTIAINNRDLLTLDINENSQRIQGANGELDPNAWLNPCHYRVRKFMVDMIVEVVKKYPVAGIQLDDHFCFPQEMGYDKFSQQLFQQHNFGDMAPIEHDSEVWVEWGAAQLTELLQQIVSAVKSARRDCIVSISPNPLTFSRNRYLADWQKWQELGLMDELVLQVYRDRIDAFELELTKPEVQAARLKIPTSIGILAGLRTRPIPSPILKEQVAIVSAGQFSGLACFFYETLFHEQLAPNPISRTKSQLFDIFDPTSPVG